MLLITQLILFKDICIHEKFIQPKVQLSNLNTSNLLF